jgi:DUF1680 family protein
MTAAMAFGQNAPATQPKTSMNDYPIQPVPFTAVHLHDEFWSPKIEINRTVTIPFAFEQCERNVRLYNFQRAAARLRGEAVTDTKQSEFPFDDTDVYKVIEGAAYSMAVTPDPKLDAYVDKLIEQIAAAQEPDGYLYTTRTLSPEHPHPWAGPERWVLERELSHELYNLGHLYEAAVAHFQATGKRTLLNVAIKTADLLDRTFGPGKQPIWPGHQITEMGLVKLYRVTGEERYLKLAKFLLDVRGPDGKPGSGREYNQSHQPVIEQREAVGHAVRAVYMYSGMADVAAITGDTSYLTAIDAIWTNVAEKKLYITGGIGSTKDGEAFGPNYDLPNATAYCETCAAIGNVYWNQRMFLLHGDAKYIDVLERSLYNGLISGVSLDGRTFFYPNPLASDGTHARSPWFGCACCPSNICRFMASIPGYFYAQRNDELFVNLYAAGKATLKLPNDNAVTLEQSTQYPWRGDVRIAVLPSQACNFAINLRIPGWARGRVVPSDLYRYVTDPAAAVSVAVNGESVKVEPKSGYVTIRRDWKAGDTIEMNLPMPVQQVQASDKVNADAGRVAIERGPIVYCFEWPDQAGKKPSELVLDAKAGFTDEPLPSGLGNGVALRGPAGLAIPYYTWANRGKGEMAVWAKAGE